MPFLPPNQQCQSTEGNTDVRISEIKYNKSCGYHIFYFPLDVRNEAEVLKSVASTSRRRNGVQLDRTRVTRIASSILSIPGRADHHTAGFVIQVELSARCVCVCVCVSKTIAFEL